MRRRREENCSRRKTILLKSYVYEEGERERIRQCRDLKRVRERGRKRVQKDRKVTKKEMARGDGEKRDEGG